MANIEFFSGFEENKYAPEYKEFKAEVYQRPPEFASGAPEIKKLNFESFDDQGAGEYEKERSKKKRVLNEDKKKKSARSRVQKIFDSISKSAAKVTTTVVGVAAVGIGAVVALSPLFTPTEPAHIEATLNDLTVGGNYVSYELIAEELSPEVDYDIIISSGKQKFVKDDVVDGVNTEFIVGLDTDTRYTLSLVGKQDGESTVHYERNFKTNSEQIIDEEYQAIFEPPLFNDITVEWLSDKNTINIPTLFTPHSDPNYRYRVSIIDEDHTVISSYEGAEELTTVSLDVPLDVDRVRVSYETLYDTGKHEHLYSQSQTSELVLKAPEIILGDKVLDEPGYYLISYKISTELHNEHYDEISFTLNGVDAGQDNIMYVNQYYTYLVGFDTHISEFDLEATVTYEAPYGGNYRTVSASKHYVNELEFIDDSYYSFEDDEVVFSFNYSEIGGYVLLKNESDSTEEQLPSGTHYYPLSSETTYTYALYSQSGEMLSEEKSVTFAPLDSYPSFNINQTNPGDLLTTFNDDGTINIYNDTGFVCDDPNVFYEITYRSVSHRYTHRSQSRLSKSEDMEYGTYSVEYRVIYVDESGYDYELIKVVPSGTTSPSIDGYVSCNILDDQTIRFEFYNLAYNGNLIATIDGKEYVFTGEDIVYDEYVYYYIIETNEFTGSEISLCLSARHNGFVMDEVLANYGEEIKGSPYITKTLYFGG